MNEDHPSTTRQRVRRALLIVLARVVAACVVLVVLFYTLPLDRLESLSLGVGLALWVIVLAGATAVAIRVVARSKDPSVVAIEAAATLAVLFVMLFATGYYVLQVADPSSFSEDPLTRTDALYFTITVLSTVGFGDITASSQVARVLVTLQMVLNVVFIGVGVKLITKAVKVGRAHHTPPDQGAEASSSTAG
jgi:hypothetical protein